MIEQIFTNIDMCIAGIERNATDTLWVYDESYPNRPQTIVECLHEIKDALKYVEALKTSHNSVSTQCDKCKHFVSNHCLLSVNHCIHQAEDYFTLRT